MHNEQSTVRTWRIGIDLAAFVALAAVAGMVAAVTLAGIAILLTSAASTSPAASPEAPVRAPAAKTMVAADRPAS